MEVKTTFTIRQAGPADSALVATLAAGTFREAFAAATPPEDMEAYLAKAFDERAVRQSLEDPATEVHVLFDDGLPAGYTKMTAGDSPVPAGAGPAMALERIYVRARHYGTGAGKALMEHAVARARALGKKVLWLGVWQENGRAIAFYKKWGFEIYGTKKFTLGRTVNDDYLMKLTL